jgi:hypothetical protein
VLANKDDLLKVFGTKDEEAVCRLVRLLFRSALCGPPSGL